MNIMQWILEHKWAITPTALETIVNIVNREDDLTPEFVSKVMHGSTWERYLDESGKLSDFCALEGYDYPILEGTRRVSLADQVAILPVVGPIFPRANLMTLSGGASVQSLAYDFGIAVRSPSVSAIIMEYDTPGGEITGIADFSKLILEARAKKPIISFIYGLGLSAGYWLSSAGKEVVIGDTAEAGSIGVVALYTSDKKRREKGGYEDIEVVSSQSPNKRPDPSTDVGRKAIQETVDTLASVFIASVASNRGVEIETVLSKYGKGGIFVGKAAVEAGLADRMSTLESLIAELNTSTKQTSFSIGGSMTLQELKDKHPDVYAEAVAVGRKEAEADQSVKMFAVKSEGIKLGAENERNRIKGIEAISVPGSDKIIAENKFNPEATAETVSALIVADQKAVHDRMQVNFNKDAADLAKSAKGIGTENTPEGDAEQGAVCAAMKEGFNAY